MSTQYNAIGERYKTFKELPVVSIEAPSVLKRLGDVNGLNCLDLACGLGHYSQLLLKQDAASVTGVDISEEMIQAASTSLTESQESKIIFEVGDCSKPFRATGGPFDLAFAGWFLNYAPDFSTMLQMWRNIHHNLKGGGRFVAIAPNTFCPMFEPMDECYGMIIRPIEQVKDREFEGWKCRLTAHVQPQPVEFEMYHFLHDFYEKAATEAGMTDVKWYPTVPPDDEKKESGFWDVYMLRPHMTILTARKP